MSHKHKKKHRHELENQKLQQELHKQFEREQALQNELRALQDREEELQNELLLQRERGEGLENQLEVHRDRELELEEVQNELEAENDLLKRQSAYTRKHHPNKDILFLATPGPITIGLRGKELTFELSSLRIASDQLLNGRQTGQLLGVLLNLVKLIGSLISNQEQDEDSI